MKNGKFKMKDYLTCGYSLDRRSGEMERLWRTLSNHIRSIVRKIPQRSHLYVAEGIWVEADWVRWIG